MERDHGGGYRGLGSTLRPYECAAKTASKITENPPKKRKNLGRNQGKMGQPEKPWYERRRVTSVNISPYHTFVLTRLMESGVLEKRQGAKGFSDAIAQLIEAAANDNGVTLDEMLALPDPEQYIRGTKT